MKQKSNTDIYARVSTKDQNIVAQLRYLKHYAQEKGLSIYKVYADKVVSGMKDNWLALGELMSDCSKEII